MVVVGFGDIEVVGFDSSFLSPCYNFFTLKSVVIHDISLLIELLMNI